MAYDKTKYDIYLNEVGYRLANYQKQQQNPFVPRFGGGDQNAGDLDLFKAAQINGFSDGSLQRRWDLDTMAFAIEGLYPRYDDGVLYKTPQAETLEDTTKALYRYYSTKEYLFRFRRTYTSATTSAAYSSDDGATWTSISVPTAYTNEVNPLSGACILDNYLYIGVDNSENYRIDLSTPGTMTASSTTWGWEKLVEFRGKIYFNGQAGLGTLYTADDYSTYTTVGAVGSPKLGVHDLLVFNHRIIILKPDGMFAYDGVQITPILDYSHSADPRNFKFGSIIRGWLHYFMPDGMYRFNGVTIEKLYSTDEIGYPDHATAGEDKYWLLYNLDENTVSRYDDALGYSFTSDQFNGRIMVYDGQGLFSHCRLETQSKSTEEADFTGQGVYEQLTYHNGALFIPRYYQRYGYNAKVATSGDPSAQTLTGVNNSQIVTSIFDGGMPFIDKYLESVELVFDGHDTAAAPGTKFKIDYRTTGFDGNTGWTNAGEITAQEITRINLWSDEKTVTFKELQVRIYPDSTIPAELGISKLVMRYTLSPELKYEWSLTINAFGAKSTEPLKLADGTDETNDTGLLRGNIYEARRSLSPVYFTDVDVAQLDTAIDSSTNITQITLSTTSAYQLLPESGIVQIGNEKFIYYSRTDNVLSLHPSASVTPTTTRGLLGSTAEAHSSGDDVHIVYRAFVRDIVNERIILDDQRDNLDAHNSQITILLQEA